MIKNRIVRWTLLLIISIVLSILIFIVLGYNGLELKIIEDLLIITGDNHWEGETKSLYLFNAMCFLFVLIFVIVAVTLKCTVFRKKHRHDISPLRH
jgi:hypothetical protein